MLKETIKKINEANQNCQLEKKIQPLVKIRPELQYRQFLNVGGASGNSLSSHRSTSRVLKFTQTACAQDSSHQESNSRAGNQNRGKTSSWLINKQSGQEPQASPNPRPGYQKKGTQSIQLPHVEDCGPEIGCLTSKIGDSAQSSKFAKKSHQLKIRSEEEIRRNLDRYYCYEASPKQDLKYVPPTSTQSQQQLIRLNSQSQQLEGPQHAASLKNLLNEENLDQIKIAQKRIQKTTAKKNLFNYNQYFYDKFTKQEKGYSLNISQKNSRLNQQFYENVRNLVKEVDDKDKLIIHGMHSLSPI